MARLRRFISLEEAERAGSVLVDHGIDVHIRDFYLCVDQDDAARARQILGIDYEDPDEPDPNEPPPIPYRPCPACGVDDPLWYGRRKAIVLLAIIVVVCVLGAVASSKVFDIAFVVSICAFIVSTWFIPEYECRNCHHRWTKQGR